MHVLGVTLLLLFAQRSSQFTFEDFEKAILSPENDELCRKEYGSFDSSAKFKFFDASAKIPDGALQGHFMNLGAYDECISIEIPEKDALGKYCLASMDITNLIDPSYGEIHKKVAFLSNLTEAVLKTAAPGPPLKAASIAMPATFGLCIPHHCSNNYVFEKILKLTFTEATCATKNTYSTMTTEAQVALYILIAFVVVAILSTIYDLVRIHNNTEPAHDILIAFSLFTNTKKLCQSSNNPNQLLCLNGIKTLNMFWVISGHFIMNTMRGPIDNTLDFIPWYTSYSNMIFVGATISVDSFFTIGGLLSVYTLLRSKDPGLKENIKGIPLLYIHRYLRLTPAFAIIIYIYASGLLKYVSDGPQWFETDASLGTGCRNYWWMALIYFQNYSHTQVCVMQSWYLSVDMQLFLLSPLVWIPLRRWPKATLKAMFGLAILGIVVPFVIGYCYKLPAMIGGYPDNGFITKYYFATHTRFGPYVIGMIAGYFVYHAKKAGKTRISPPALVWLWAIVIVVGYACIFAGFPLIKAEAIDFSFQPQTNVDESTRWWNAVYLGFNRSLWSAVLSLLIYLCVTGNGGPVDWFLSASPMQFMAKLSYCIYLNHIIILSIKQFQARTVFHFGNYEILNQLISLIVLSIPLAICQTLLFESPMIIIEKILFGKNKPKTAAVKTKADA